MPVVQNLGCCAIGRKSAFGTFEERCLSFTIDFNSVKLRKTVIIVDFTPALVQTDERPRKICCRRINPILFTTFIACENRRRFATFDGVPAKWRLRSEGRNSILMTRHYLDLNSASDWFRSTTQIWVATRLTQIKTDTLIGKFRIPRRPWDEHDCEANAGQRLWKKKKKR